MLEDVAPIAALDDPVRRRTYLAVREAREPLTREEVAAQVGISRRLAAFHLEKLLERGLLEAHYERDPGRGGPGAGRPPKRYRPSGAELGVSIPERHYDLAGELLVDAIVEESPGQPARDVAMRVARERGYREGRAVNEEQRLRRPGPERTLAVARDVLAGHGFEPVPRGQREVVLRNCPFHVLARRAPDVVCGMNQAFVDGLLRGLGNDTVEAALTRVPGECCVTLVAP